MYASSFTFQGIFFNGLLTFVSPKQMLSLGGLSHHNKNSSHSSSNSSRSSSNNSRVATGVAERRETPSPPFPPPPPLPLRSMPPPPPPLQASTPIHFSTSGSAFSAHGLKLTDYKGASAGVDGDFNNTARDVRNGNVSSGNVFSSSMAEATRDNAINKLRDQKHSKGCAVKDPKTLSDSHTTPLLETKAAATIVSSNGKVHANSVMLHKQHVSNNGQKFLRDKKMSNVMVKSHFRAVLHGENNNKAAALHSNITVPSEPCSSWSTVTPAGLPYQQNITTCSTHPSDKGGARGAPTPLPRSFLPPTPLPRTVLPPSRSPPYIRVPG